MPFKISSINLSIIPSKYREALALLEEKKLLKEDTEYLLNSWTFLSKKKGALSSEFSLNYIIRSYRSGRTIKTEYDSFSFKVNSDNKLTFIK